MNRYDKLIRDKIPEVIAADGKRCKIRVLPEAELLPHLLAKLREEVAEFERGPCVEELADIVEVLVALASQVGSSMAEVERVRQHKRAARGGFEQRLFLEYVE